jgi:hypothetical protein
MKAQILDMGRILMPIPGGWTNWMLLGNRTKTMFGGDSTDGSATGLSEA